MKSLRLILCVEALSLLVCGASLVAEPPSDLGQLEQQAVSRAVDFVAPCVVRIQTTGGLEQAGTTLKGTGPTTGLVVGAEGWIVSSAFNFANNPAGILVILPDGKRLAAKIAGTDHARMLTLLKVEASDLPEPIVAPKSQMRTGQWAIALGRTWSQDRPSVSLGIISALGRVWGKAIQTDAKVSPVNYGGPLIDLQGRVLGVLVPLSPQQSEVTAGVEWYDSGIGFAIPLEDILASLDRLKSGDLKPGLAGLAFAPEQDGKPPKIAKVAWRSPAAQAGLQKDDVIVSVDNRPVRRDAELRTAVGGKYAGDVVTVVVERAGQRRTTRLKLIDTLPAYRRPFLGILTERANDEMGLTIRHVLPGSPADRAGLKEADRLIQWAGAAVNDRNALESLLDEREIDETVQVTIRRGEETLDRDVKVGSFPQEVPKVIPAFKDSPPARRLVERDLAKSGGKYWVSLPQDAKSGPPMGVVLWFGGPKAPGRDSVISRWERVLRDRRLLLVGIAPRNATAWSKEDMEVAKEALADLASLAAIDPSRVIAHGMGDDAALAELFTQSHRSEVRGLALVGGGIFQGSPPEPDEKLAYYVLWGKSDPQAAAFSTALERLGKQRFPAIGQAMEGGAGEYPSREEMDAIGRWSELVGAL